MAILDNFDLSRPVRLVGVCITNRIHEGSQLPLIESDGRRARVAAAMDETNNQTNNRFGDFTVTFASVLDTEDKGSHVISPARRPDGIRRVDVR